MRADAGERPGVARTLGMTADAVLALFPDSKEDADLRSRLTRPPNQFRATVLGRWSFRLVQRASGCLR